MHRKGEFTFPVLVCNQRNLSKKASSAANTKRNECSLLVSVPPVKIIFLKIDFACILKMESLSTPFHKAFAFFLNKMLQFLETEAALYIK